MTATYRRCLVMMQAAELQPPPSFAGRSQTPEAGSGTADPTTSDLLCVFLPLACQVRGHCLQSPGPGCLFPTRLTSSSELREREL